MSSVFLKSYVSSKFKKKKSSLARQDELNPYTELKYRMAALGIVFAIVGATYIAYPLSYHQALFNAQTAVLGKKAFLSAKDVSMDMHVLGASTTSLIETNEKELHTDEDKNKFGINVYSQKDRVQIITTFEDAKPNTPFVYRLIRKDVPTSGTETEDKILQSVVFNLEGTGERKISLPMQLRQGEYKIELIQKLDDEKLLKHEGVIDEMSFLIK